jgi:hypothetical protein
VLPPRLLSIFGSVCLLAEPCQVGNPVISLPGWWDPRLEVVAPDLRTYLLDYFSHLLGIDMVRLERRIAQVEQERMALYRAIPFWGPILRRANLP